jgi:metal-sulfur cluster biosynthetic enzyme
MPAPADREVKDAAYPYRGPEALRWTIRGALRQVVDPEVSLSIVDVGLIYGVDVSGSQCLIRLTMTSAACPVTHVIVSDVHCELEAVLPAGLEVAVEVVWEPPWDPAMMSARARRYLDG